MPRPNQARDIYAEDHLARRIAWERERRGWTYEGLAKRMTEAGCAMNQSAIYKIEQLTPRRRITVDELVGFSRVFGVPVDDLLLDPAVVVGDRVREAMRAWREAMLARRDALHAANVRVTAAEQEVRDAVAAAPVEARAALEALMRDWYGDSHWATDVPEMILNGGGMSNG